MKRIASTIVVSLLPTAPLVISGADRGIAQPTSINPPELIDIVPASGPAGIAYPLRATIRGTGFMRAENVVQFGPVKLSVPSIDADRITFSIPKGVPSRSEVPPMVLSPGEYRVTVTTMAGTSNALIFTLTPGP
jgi:hypothetical protein